jgi:vancomycin resistance protein YoaR
MRNLLLILLAVLSIAVILLLQPALQFSQSIGAVPPGVQLAGNAYRRAGAAEVAAALDNTYAEPVAVFYAGQRIILRPKMLGFEVDADAMLAEAQGAGTLPRVVLQFFGELIRYPPRPVEIPLQYTYNHEALDSWLADVANRYDRPATDPRPIVSQLTIAPGQPGWQLDLPGSRERVLAALASPQARNVDLALREAPAPPIDMKALETLLRARLDEF